MHLDPHARPPESMKALFKKWRKATVEDIESSSEILDLSFRDKNDRQLHNSTRISTKDLAEIYRVFLGNDTCSGGDCAHAETVIQEVALLNKLLHRDLSNSSHKSNLHLHYMIPYPRSAEEQVAESFDRSFFYADQTNLLCPKDTTIHKPLTIKQMLNRKLRWVTLGGQYDWTAKVYPPEDVPQFPEDIARLLKGMFPDVDAQAAIVNFYTPGDTLSVHRDVSEDCDRGLISISIGCDGLFIVGNEDGTHSATLRLRSGDVLLMSGESRYAWHAVPRILPESCPKWLRLWPAGEDGETFSEWSGWISNKRINLNVRQMRA